MNDAPPTLPELYEPPEVLEALAEELEGRIAAAEARLAELEAKARLVEAVDSRLVEFRRSIYQSVRRAGRGLDVVEREVLVMLVRGVLGMPLLDAPPERIGAYGAACERLKALGYLAGQEKGYRPNMDGIRLGIVLFEDY